MRLYKTDKLILSIRKPDVKSFLNGLTSNTLDSPRNAFLTIHGRIVATFDQVMVSEDECLVVIERPFAGGLLQHLERYIKLGGVSVEPYPQNVYFDLDDSVPPEKGDHWIAQKKGKLLITPREMEGHVSDEEFTVFRLDHHIPVHGIDFKDEMLLNISISEFVSFKKGCFLGQEPISKVYNRSKPSWRLVVKKFDDCSAEEKEKMTSQAVHPVLGQKMGFVFEKNDD
ncbi:MAG: hypothetical protein AB7S78_10340 [Candidatus Omnitrophota bacterium]